MRTRLGKLVGGLAAGAATLALMSMPASANTMDAELQSGDINLYDSNNDPVSSVSLGTGSGTDCSAANSSITMSSASSWSAVLDSDTAINIPGYGNARVDLNGSLSGSIAGSALSGTGSATAAIQKTSGAGSCTTTSGACTLTVSNLTVNGSHTVASPPTIVAGDTATVSGDNGPGGDFGYETDASGSASDCGVLINLIDGSVALDTVVVEAV